MFTGIIEEMGTIENIAKGAHSAVLTINARKILEDVHIGDSIAVTGVCRRSLPLTTKDLLRMSCMKL